MCLNPINIKNPRQFYRLGLDRLTLSVSCGECLECRKQKTNDWFVRLAYEYKDCISHGGSVYFVTLTYNNQSVPVLDTTSEEFLVLNDVHGEFVDGVSPTVPKFCHKGFNKKQVRNFFKSMRQWFTSPSLPQRYRLNIPDGVKYFLVSEYGGTTHRPHYHFLLFLPKKVPTWELKKVLELSWSNRVKYDDAPEFLRLLLNDDYYKKRLATDGFIETKYFLCLPPRRGQLKPQIFRRNGFVSWSEHGAEVKSVKCVRYILKYLFKDSEFMRQPCVTLLHEYVKELPAIKTIHNEFHLKCIHKLKDFFPFSLSSNYIGDALFRQLDLENLDENETVVALDKLTTNQVTVPDAGVCMYAIPKYIIRRLFYYVRDVGQKENVVILNHVGKEVLKLKYDSSIDFAIKNYQLVTSDAFLSLANDPLRVDFKAKFGHSIASFLMDYNYRFNSAFASASLKDLAVYSLVYRGVCYKGNDTIPFLSLSELTSFAEQLYIKKIETYNEDEKHYYYNLPTPVCDLPYHVFSDMSYLVFDRLSVFDGFDEILTQIEWLKTHIIHLELFSKEQKKIHRDKLHKLYVNFMYNN